MIRLVETLLFCILCIYSIQTQSDLCTTEQQNFAMKQSEFMNCAVMKSEPVEYCIACNAAYLSFLSSYDDLMQAQQPSKNMSCRSLLVDIDRLNLIENINAYTRNLWNMGYCSDCYDCDTDAMTANCSLSNRTIAFNAQFNKTHECISTNRTHACPYCVENYQELNDLYDKIRSLKRDKFCFDTKDKMNKTRILWSNELHCCGHRDSSKLIFSILAATAIVIFVGFYFGSFVFEKRAERRYFHLPNDAVNNNAERPIVNDDSKSSTSHETTNRSNHRRSSESSNDLNDDER